MSLFLMSIEVGDNTIEHSRYVQEKHIPIIMDRLQREYPNKTILISQVIEKHIPEKVMIKYNGYKYMPNGEVLPK